MSKPLQIVTYTPGDHSALRTFMSDLQDLERGWSSDRSPGPEMATDHIDYLLELADNLALSSYFFYSGIAYPFVAQP